MEVVFYKKHPKDKVLWGYIPGKKGSMLFSFDKKEVFSVYVDYPHNLTAEQRAIFDKENPFWVDFYSDSDRVRQ